MNTKFHRDIEQAEYTKENLYKDLKWALRALLVISLLVALKYLDQNN